MIATFEDEPYRAPFSGNVIELCPVGALTSTQYRFEARPWEIQNVPTVCGLCPVGCNVSATTREGKVKRILSRNHPEVDEGWLCDKGRFAFAHLRADDRIEDPLRKDGPRRLRAARLGRRRSTRPSGCSRAAGSAIVTALSGTETVEQAYGLAKLLRLGLGAHAAVLPEDVPDALDAFRAPLSSIRDAKVVVVLCDEPVVERAPVVDLWIKAARRDGARVLTEHARRAGRGRCADHRRRRARAVVRPRPGRRRRVLPPRTPNGRGVADAWSAAADGEPADVEPQLADRLGRRGRRRSRVRALCRARRGRDRDRHVRGLLPRLVRPRPARHELPRARRHHGQPRGPPPAPAPRGDRALPRRARLDRRSSPSGSGSSSRRTPRSSSRSCRERCYGGIAFADGREQAVAAAAPAAASRADPGPRRRRCADGEGLRLLTYRPLFSGAAVERTPELAFQRPQR